MRNVTNIKNKNGGKSTFYEDLPPFTNLQLGILDSNQYIADSESAALPIWRMPNELKTTIS